MLDLIGTALIIGIWAFLALASMFIGFLLLEAYRIERDRKKRLRDYLRKQAIYRDYSE